MSVLMKDMSDFLRILKNIEMSTKLTSFCLIIRYQLFSSGANISSPSLRFNEMERKEGATKERIEWHHERVFLCIRMNGDRKDAKER